MTLLLVLAALAIVLLAARRGWRRGGVVTLLRWAAVLAGGLLGLAAARLLSGGLAPVAHLFLVVACVIGGLLVGLGVARALAGRVVERPVAPDRLLGAALYGLRAGVVCLLLLSLVGVGLAPREIPLVGAAAQLAPDDLRALVPTAAAASAPDADVISSVAAAVEGSVGIVDAGCGANVVGTGFVVADELVVTNVHVVRDARSVTFRLGDESLAASVVALDRRTDLAVLRVAGLTASPLPLAGADAENGTAVVIVGYPAGGPRTAVGGVVLQRLPAPNPGLADGLALHETYRLRAVIHPGNSGSPVLDTGGRVVGVANATFSGDTQAMAITVAELRHVLASIDDSRAAATAACP